MKRRLFLLFVLFLTMHVFAVDDELNSAEIQIPFRFDTTSTGLYQFQVPLTLGLPVDVGMGLNGYIPAAYLYVFDEQKREKRLFFKNQVVEIQRIKLMWGLSEEFLYEFRYQKIYNDTFSIQPVLDFLQLSFPVTAIPLTYSLDFRTFGSALNPVINATAFGFTKAGPIELDLNFNLYKTREDHHGLFELGFKGITFANTNTGIELGALNPFGIVLGDLVGGFANINLNSRAMRLQPRFAAGYSRQTEGLAVGLLLHDDAHLKNNANFKLNTLLLFSTSGNGFWSVNGEYAHSDTFSTVFNCSMNSFYIENKYVMNFTELFGGE
ncbi:MAG TPA: hypothetical protein PK466_05235 [Thermotogota bacterium]|nr:hypothetical protein [Thermotogota bacterium]HPJ88752.1 hypothetical protein [Thermotogota bacterium]HPR95713.1 hypothetical protein [Thermotogota bacterium]